ncbi:hemin uptake protein HemP [Roseiconus nitratireducens]|uniref:Hemin uptake protein HemP n=1 Tax=Roseiconus nitratireducens TaxID=2605748 RepID=A0A5M6D9U9_9BACT|nr:hemin uptake protein HemP [Roseiconus nitratireducens]KAA5543200.1 hemin uptake protein HemP [Roseiconus nitratireducens]
MAFPSDNPSDQREKTTARREVWDRHLAGKIVRFKDLTPCGDEIWIEHDGQLYRLRKTRQGKLILTK